MITCMARRGWRPASSADKSAMQAGFPASAPASCTSRTTSPQYAVQPDRVDVQALQAFCTSDLSGGANDRLHTWLPH